MEKQAVQNCKTQSGQNIARKALIMPCRVIQGHQFWHQVIARLRLPIGNTNLHLILHIYQVVADCWSNFCYQQGVPVFYTVVWDEPLNSGLCKLTSRN